MAIFGARSGHEVGDLRRAIDEQHPDARLIDCMAWGATAAAETSELLWAQWFPYPLPLSSRGVPPFGPGLAPARGPFGRLRDGLLHPVLHGALNKASLPALNATRASVGVRPFTTAEETFTLAPLLLYMTAEPFEYPRAEWPATIRMVGPCCWEPPSEAPAWLAGITRPLVLVTTSSEFQDDGRSVRTALDAPLAGEDVNVVATLPSARLEGKVPANARVEAFIAHGPLLEKATCAITHGGAGATQKALAAGVPVCVVPFGRDQLEVARRVEVADAGTRLPAQKLSPEPPRPHQTRDDQARRCAAGR